MIGSLDERFDEKGHMTGRGEEGLGCPFIVNDDPEMIYFDNRTLVCGDIKQGWIYAGITLCETRIARAAETRQALSLDNIIGEAPRYSSPPPRRDAGH